MPIYVPLAGVAAAVAVAVLTLVGGAVVEWWRRCPHCGARDTRIDDHLAMRGRRVNFPLCGTCGKNHRRLLP
jgi:hypothetical protein